PTRGALINPPRVPLGAHHPSSVSDTAIVPTVVGLGLLEVREDFRRANKQPGINRVVAPQIFANASHFVSTRLNLHRVIQIDNRMELAIYGDIKQAGLEIF